ncbi:hypothetical protein JCM8097_000769 [Rhodosporidiobolus ruineniae]
MPPPVLDPYPGFERTVLPDLSSLDQLLPFQLALVPFHPEATHSHIAHARALFQQRRVASIARKEQLGLPEKQAELRQLERARDWLEGRAPGSKKMVACASPSTQERLFTSDEVKERVRTVSKAAVERALGEQKKQHDAEMEEERRKGVERTREAVESAVRLALTKEKAVRAPARVTPPSASVTRAHQPPPTSFTPSFPSLPALHLPTPPAEDPPPGPFFDFDSSRTTFIPPELRTLLHSIRLDDLFSPATCELVFQFLRVQPKPFPRPLALSKPSTTSMTIAFASRYAAQMAVAILNGASLPLIKCPVHATALPGSVAYLWSDTSIELALAWETSRSLPPSEFIRRAPPATKGVRISLEYQAEWEKIEPEVKRQRAEKKRQKNEERKAAKYAAPPVHYDFAQPTKGPASMHSARPIPAAVAASYTNYGLPAPDCLASTKSGLVVPVYSSNAPPSSSTAAAAFPPRPSSAIVPRPPPSRLPSSANRVSPAPPPSGTTPTNPSDALHTPSATGIARSTSQAEAAAVEEERKRPRIEW